LARATANKKENICKLLLKNQRVVSFRRKALEEILITAKEKKCSEELISLIEKKMVNSSNKCNT
jgi:hypothetical protein